jgi:nucleoside-triphosphatase THEP1
MASAVPASAEPTRRRWKKKVLAVLIRQKMVLATLTRPRMVPAVLKRARMVLATLTRSNWQVFNLLS